MMGLLSACQRAEKEPNTSLKFSLGDIGAQSTSSLSEMKCFGIFVSVPASESPKYRCSYSTETASNFGGFPYSDFYGPFYKNDGAVGSNFTIKVPNGSHRVLRLVGAKINTAAGTTIPSTLSPENICLNLNRQYMDSFYTLAESKPLQLQGEDLTVDLTAIFDSTKEIPSTACTSFQKDGVVAGTPDHIAVSIQDDRVSNTNKWVSSSNCIGIKFQLQDAINRPISFTSTINAEVVESVGGVSVGNFYNPAASPNLDLCGAVNLAPIHSGKVSLSFAAGTTDHILYFKPSSSFGTAIPIEVAAVSGSTIKGRTDAVYYMSGTRVSSKYAFYDLFNNVSSVKSTASTPAVIRRSECRFGAVQFLDQNSVPYAVSTSSNTPDSIRVKALPLGSVEFFPTQSTCATGTQAASEYVISMATNTSATGFGFFYKVTASAPNSIAFEVKNMQTTAYPVISSGDLTINDNLWQISN